MEKQKDKKDFFLRVLELVKKIPYGYVTTYGSIAQCLGLKSSARMVGWALNSAAADYSIPCHRVVNRNGELTGKQYFATPEMMRELLESEGITFKGDQVNMQSHFTDAALFL
ncbi:MAG: MGMT family protein [Candidatus Kapabacteria bacterium]|nr:MGMT family protein [Candidatus Kapabacteria bacterium]